MEITSRGSKPVRYLNTIRLNFNAAQIAACEAKLGCIFTKIVENGSVAVYGDYTLFLLFCYRDSSDRRIFKTDTHKTRFTEFVSCPLPANAPQGALSAQATFVPRASFEHVSGTAFDVTVEGEIDVVLYGGPLPPDPEPAQSPTDAENATVVRLCDTALSAQELFSLDHPTLKKLTNLSGPNPGAQRQSAEKAELSAEAALPEEQDDSGFGDDGEK